MADTPDRTADTLFDLHDLGERSAYPRARAQGPDLGHHGRAFPSGRAVVAGLSAP
jgi:hypothetical protein